MKIKGILLLAVLWMTACVPLQLPANEPGTLPPDSPLTNPPAATPEQETGNNPYAPQPADSSLTQGAVFIQEKDLLIRESYPPQISLSLNGDLPTPCHELRLLVSEPEQDYKINVDVYSVMDPNMACIQVLEPFQASVDLGTFPSGHYSVWVNDELAGEFDS
jgi:hypothetical protein